jgi:hypothetical protein
MIYEKFWNKRKLQMKIITNAVFAVLIASALSPAAVLASQTNSKSYYGHPSQPNAATRTVVVTSSTKYVNVDQDDVVTFVVNGNSFTWQFDTLRPSDSVDLSSIAPREVSVPAVSIYVAPNPIYQN